MRIESRIARLIPISPGDTVGYNRTFRAAHSTTGALIPIGYADGYRRSLARKAWVGIAGQRAPLLGRVSMDQIVVAIPPGCAARVGEKVQVMGGAPELCAPSIADMAEMMETNTYEVLVGIRQRIPRLYVQNGKVVAVRSQSGAYATA
jgi:alanine racemase